MEQGSINVLGVREQCVLVSNAIYQSISSLLGPGYKLKAFIDADGSGTLTRSVVKILDKLDVEDHPVGLSYKMTSEGYVAYVGESGLCTLVTLIGLLVKKGNELEAMGIPFINVVEGFRTAANVCEDILHSIAIPFSALSSTHKSPSSDSINDITGSTTKGTLSPLDSATVPENPNSQLADMLAKLRVSLPSSSLPEMKVDDDVSWFFDEEADATAIPATTPPSHSGFTPPPTVDITIDRGAPSNNSHTDLLQIIGDGLARGNEDMMAIAAQVARILEEDEDDEWNMRRLVVRHVPFQHASVTDGLLVHLRDCSPISCSCPHILDITQPTPFKDHHAIHREWKGRVCVVDGSPGNFELNLEGVSKVVKADEWEYSKREAEVNEERYNQEALALLDAHGVKLLVTSGDAKSSLVEALHSRSIHVLNVQGSDWDYFCFLTGEYPLGDILEVTTDFLSPVMRIEFFSIGSKWEGSTKRRYKVADKEFKSESYLRITSGPGVKSNAYFPVSIALGGVSKSLGEERERQFWNCLHRLRNSVKTHKVLPGGGWSEIRCILGLEECAKAMTREGSSIPKSAPTSNHGGLNHKLLEAEAVKGFSVCLEEYLILLTQNIGISPYSSIEEVLRFKASVADNPTDHIHAHISSESDQGSIYDDLLAKVEGYQRAVNATAIILSIRAIVVEKQNKMNVT